jgi:glutamine amidotransferase
MLAVIDYGAGNLRSVLHALTHLGAENIRIVQGPRDLKGATQIILPGVGAFGAGMEELRKRDLIQPIKHAAFAGIPFLGICLGMQFLFDRSDEMGDFAGLGLMPGTVTRFPADMGLKVPHMGWNTLIQSRLSALMDGLGEQNYAYFVHSYHCVPTDSDDVVATVDYGIPAVAVVQRGNIAGVQFHPEKSQTTGLRILANFLKGAA